jgi:hypothetical protein
MHGNSASPSASGKPRSSNSSFRLSVPLLPSLSVYLQNYIVVSALLGVSTVLLAVSILYPSSLFHMLVDTLTSRLSL